MAINIYPAPTAGGEALPIGASEKIHEVFSPTGYLDYAPVGGLSAGRYIVEAQGSDVDYIEAVAPGQARSGRGNYAYIQATSGRGITATAGTFGDDTIAGSTRNYTLPQFTLDLQGYYTYSFSPGNPVVKHNGNYVLMTGTSTGFRVATSRNGSAWREYGDSLSAQGWSHLGDTTSSSRSHISDLKVIGNFLYAVHPPVNGSGVYRTADLTGNSGWSRLNDNSGWNILGSPVSGSSRLFLFGSGFIWTSDNSGSSWTASSGGAPSASWNYYSPVVKGNDIYALASQAFFSGGQLSYIVRSTNNGASWSTVYTFPNSNSFPISLTYSSSLDRFVVATRDSLGNNRLWLQHSSDNCVTWTNSSYAETDTSDLGYSKVVWFPPANKFVATVKNGGQLWDSVNGTSWSFRRDSPGNANSILAVYENELLYKSHDLNNSALGRTSDLVNFFDSAPSFSTTYSVAFTAGTYLISGGGNLLLAGPSLDNLSIIDLSITPLSFQVRELVGGNGIFMAKSNVNEFYYSTNGGATWVAGGPNSMASSPHFFDGKFLRIDTSRRLWVSTDCVTWTNTATLLGSYRNIKRIKDVFYAYSSSAGFQEGYAYSTDLINWTHASFGTTGSGMLEVEYSERDGFFYVQQSNGGGVGTKVLGSISPWSNNLSTWSLYQNLYSQNVPYTATTSQVFKCEAVNGVAFMNNGYMFKGFETGSTTTLDVLRFFQLGQLVVPPTPTGTLTQSARGLGKLVSVGQGGINITELHYGKPAYFTIYKMKD